MGLANNDKRMTNLDSYKSGGDEAQSRPTRNKNKTQNKQTTTKKEKNKQNPPS